MCQLQTSAQLLSTSPKNGIVIFVLQFLEPAASTAEDAEMDNETTELGPSEEMTEVRQDTEVDEKQGGEEKADETDESVHFEGDMEDFQHDREEELVEDTAAVKMDHDSDSPDSCSVAGKSKIPS